MIEKKSSNRASERIIERAGREASPSVSVVDSQSVKAVSAEARGYDADKKVVGRKRHIAADTAGRLLIVHLTPADIADSADTAMILDALRKRWPWVKHLFADGAYVRPRLMEQGGLSRLRRRDHPPA